MMFVLYGAFLCYRESNTSLPIAETKETKQKRIPSSS